MKTQDRLQQVHQHIQLQCERYGRNPSEVTLIAVSKKQSVNAILEAYEAGQRHFGESYLQELQTKVHKLPSDIVWHFIGKVQSNKAKNIALLADVIHTIENERQIAEFNKVDRTFEGFIQVNIAREQQKSGIFPENLDTVLSHVLKSSKVQFSGLMTIGPAVDDPEESRPIFRQLANLNREIGGKSLSMGMSHDFEVALQEGATHIRVGTAIFGER
ncbi:MAG: YggS family pyridoxal phosphate-dependent enzyme [Fimbriimonadaceae bacterium]|nr:MAG: YggS family pyridoxal phosphate-dependent enzyme [Fimbriimonadaceae bacterium]